MREFEPARIFLSRHEMAARVTTPESNKRLNREVAKASAHDTMRQ
jgi:hypothetical protein